MNAIIYTTNAGSTARYAGLLARATGLPAYSLAEAKSAVSTGAEDKENVAPLLDTHVERFIDRVGFGR